MRLDDEGDLVKCDRCGKVHHHDDGDFDLRYQIWCGVIFKGVHHTWIHNLGDFCKECAATITPLIWQLRDVYELTHYAGNLKRAIYEKRKQGTQNNRTTDAKAKEREVRVALATGQAWLYTEPQIELFDVHNAEGKPTPD